MFCMPCGATAIMIARMRVTEKIILSAKLSDAEKIRDAEAPHM